MKSLPYSSTHFVFLKLLFGYYTLRAKRFWVAALSLIFFFFVSVSSTVRPFIINYCLTCTFTTLQDYAFTSLSSLITFSCLPPFRLGLSGMRSVQKAKKNGSFDARRTVSFLHLIFYALLTSFTTHQPLPFLSALSPLTVCAFLSQILCMPRRPS